MTRGTPRNDCGAVSVNAAGFTTVGGGAERSSATGADGIGAGGLALPVNGGSGGGTFGLAMVFSASMTKSGPILAAISPPATLSIRLLTTLPTQTPPTMSAVRPANHAPPYSSVVQLCAHYRR